MTTPAPANRDLRDRRVDIVLAVFFAALSYFLLRLLSEDEESQRALEGR